MKFDLKTLTDYSDDALIGEMHRVAKELSGQRLTIERFDSFARVHSATVRNRFGSWTAALDRAGIDERIAPRRKKLSRSDLIEAITLHLQKHPNTSPTRDKIANDVGVDSSTITRGYGSWEKILAEVGLIPVRLGRRYTDEECFENVLSLWMRFGRQPHFAELNRPPSTISSKAYTRRWGGWRLALAAFVARANESSKDTVDAQLEVQSQDVRPLDLVPRSINLSQRYKILLRDKFRCVICGRSPAKDGTIELHVDHIKPWSRGGKNTETNLRTLCFDCNIGKGSQASEM